VKLIDTSSWIHQMREQGDPVVRARVEALLRAGEAAWCAMVRLEIWAGIGDERERQALRAYEAVIPELPIDIGVSGTFMVTGQASGGVAHSGHVRSLQAPQMPTYVRSPPSAGPVAAEGACIAECEHERPVDL